MIVLRIASPHATISAGRTHLARQSAPSPVSVFSCSTTSWISSMRSSRRSSLGSLLEHVARGVLLNRVHEIPRRLGHEHHANQQDQGGHRG
jgi:hypothetical protein